MKNIVLFVIVYFLASCNSSEEVSTEDRINNEEDVQEETALIQTDLIDNFSKTFKGTIDEQYEIVMNLQLEGEEMSGSYYYPKHNQEILLKGSFTNVSNEFKLEEFSNGEKTGGFTGEIGKDFNLSGFWTAFSKAPGRVASLSFEASEYKPEVAVYDTAFPIHPYFMSQIEGMGDREAQVDISKPLELPSYVKMFENTQDGFGFYIDYGEEIIIREAFFKYEYLGKYKTLYFARIAQGGGGSGIFSTIVAFELNGTILREVASICGGDRCNGGIFDAYFDNGKIYYSKNITYTDLYYLTTDTVENPYVSLRSGANDCVGSVNFGYDVITKETTFLFFTSHIDDNNIEENEENKSEIFHHLLFSYLARNEGQLNQKQLNAFVRDFIVEISDAL